MTIYQEESLEALERTKKFANVINDHLLENDMPDHEISTILSLLLIDLNMYIGFTEETFIEKIRVAWRLIEKARKEGTYD